MIRVRPLPRLRVQIPFARSFTQAEFLRLKQGSEPQTMEDRWHIFLKDPWLCFARSWTGFCVYKVRLEKRGEPYRIVEVWANRDSRQYGGTDAREDVDRLSFLIDRPPSIGADQQAVKAFFVTKRLAFGSGITKWRDVEQLQDLGITHVINLRRNVHDKKVRQFEWLWLPFKDDKQPRPRWFYKKALEFYRRALRDRNAKMFVMCRMGICRSASLTYFLLRASGKSEKEARRLVISARPWATVARAYRESGEEYLHLLQRNNSTKR